jgi:hypothetical protein
MTMTWKNLDLNTKLEIIWYICIKSVVRQKAKYNTKDEKIRYTVNANKLLACYMTSHVICTCIMTYITV